VPCAKSTLDTNEGAQRTVCTQVVDEFLKRHGNEDGGSYFLGSTYSAAETLTTPFLARSLVSLPATRDVDVLAIAEEKGLDRFVRWVKVGRTPLLLCTVYARRRTWFPCAQSVT